MKDGEIVDTREHLDPHRALVAKFLQKVCRFFFMFDIERFVYLFVVDIE